MNRLLVIGKKLPRLMCIEWRELNQYNILDFQGLILDCREHWLIPAQSSLSVNLHVFLTNGHSCFLILPEAKAAEPPGFNISFIPYLQLGMILSRGRTLNVVMSHALIHEYCKALKGHEFVLSASGTPPNWPWQNTVTDNVNRPVCGKMHGLYVFHPPAKGLEDLAFKAILGHFQPDFEELEVEPAPAWATEIIRSIPGVRVVEHAIAEIDGRLAELGVERLAQTQKKQELEKWAGMLWLDGLPLQNRVREAFQFLGFETDSKDPTGHTRDLVVKHGTTSFLVEVAGSSKSIDVDKGRQLLQWIADAEEPGKVNGLLVGNAFRSEPPGNRPPSQDHRIFTQKLEEMAARRQFALLDARDLFKLVIAKLKGDSIEPGDVCEKLAFSGVVQIGAWIVAR